MPQINVTDDEHALIMQMREWQDGIPDGALGQGKMSVVYMSLVSARAELFLRALRDGDNDLFDRRERFMKLISPHDIIKLVRIWEDHRRLLSDIEEVEMLNGADIN